MKKHAKKLLALTVAVALCLGIVGTTGAATGKKALSATYKNIGITLNGEKIALKDANGKAVEPFIIDGSTYVPVRAVSEALGLDVDWNGADNTVVLKNKPVEVRKVVANCTSEPYGKAIRSFTFYVNSTVGITDLTADDFSCTHLVYDGNEVHKPFDAKALNVWFTANTVTVEVEPFYPDMSYTRDGYWKMACTNPAFNVDPTTELAYVDPVVDSFEKFTKTYGTGEDAATLECYLYTPKNAGNGPLPILIFNSGGSGISVTGDPYGANFAVAFAKDAAQRENPCYVLYPQRNAGSTDNLCAGIKDIVDGLVSEGKVDGNRIYMTGESAGSAFTMNFVSRYPGWNTAIAIFDGAGGEYRNAATLEEAVKIDASSPFSDAETKRLADSGTKVMLVQSLGDTTSPPMGYAATYQKLVNYGMTPGVDVIWHYYTAEKFNALLGDNTHWIATADAGYVTDPITGVKTYYYPEGKLHNSSYPAANDEYIKLWLFDQSKAEYTVEFSKDVYSAQYNQTHTDFSVIPEKYTRMAVLEDVPCVPAGNRSTVTVYTDDEGMFYYIAFETFFQPGVTQYVEAIVVGSTGRVVMDCSGTWWTADINNSTMPYLLSIADTIQWQPYSR